jgi:hypothetical protein
MKSAHARAVGLVAFALLALPAGAEVRLPNVLSDHMVLQRAACASGTRRSARSPTATGAGASTST